MPYPGVELDLGFVARAPRGHDDRAGQRIPAVERALRTFQHFDLRDVRQLLVERIRIGLQYAVHHQREIGFRVAAGIDAADHDLHVAGFGGLHLRHAGRQRDEVLRPLDSRGLDVRAGERLHRRGHVLDELGALARGDHDFRQRGRLRTGIRGGQHARDGEAENGRRSDEMRHGIPRRCIQSRRPDHTLSLNGAAIQGLPAMSVYTRPPLHWPSA